MEAALRYSQEHPYIVLSTGIAISLVLGLIPLILGLKRNKRNLGIVGFVVTLLFSPIPLLAIVSVLIFTVVILVKSKPAGAFAASKKSIDVPVNSPENL